MPKLQTASRWVILLLLLVSGFWLWQVRDLTFDYDLDRFFPIEDPATRFFESFRQRFGNDNDYILLGFRPEQGLFDSLFLSRLDILTDSLAALPEVEEVASPTRFRYYRRNSNPLGPQMISSPFIHLRAPERYPADSVRLMAQGGWLGSFISEDGRAMRLQLLHRSGLTDAECAALSRRVEGLVAGMDVGQVRMAGKCFGQTTFIETIQRETFLFSGLAVAIVILLLWWAYRRLLGVLLPVAVVALAVGWTLGLMAWLGKPVDLISSVIPSILLVIGISDAVHLVTHYQLFRRGDRSMRSALEQAVREVGFATLLTTITTAVGFLTLTTSSFAPLIDMGWMATAGLFFAFLLTYGLLPAVLLLAGEVFQGFSSRAGLWHRLLLRILAWVMQHRRVVIFSSLVVTLLGAWGASRIQVNNYLLEDLRPGHPRRAAFQFFETHFTGARSIDLALLMDEQAWDPADPAGWKAIERLDDYLRNEYGAGSLLSPAELLKQANQVYHRGDPRFYRLPTDPALRTLLLERLREGDQQRLWNKLVSPREGDTWMRIHGRTADAGSKVFRVRNDSLRHWVDRNLGEAPFSVRITGTPYLLDLNNQYLARSVLLGLGLAVLLVGAIFALLLGSLRMGLLSLVPNLLPLVLVAGVMGAAGVDLKISTSIVFIIAFGIAVDDSIHFLTRFQREMKTRSSVSSALRHTYVSSGKAILLTSLMLLCGFLALTFSDFLGTFYFGGLVALTLALAALFDLTLLPVLLDFFYRHRQKP